jgi:hypothetical protein
MTATMTVTVGVRVHVQSWVHVNVQRLRRVAWWRIVIGGSLSGVRVVIAGGGLPGGTGSGAVA